MNYTSVNSEKSYFEGAENELYLKEKSMNFNTFY